MLAILPLLWGTRPLGPLDARLAMQVAISIAVLLSALYVILSDKYSSDTEKWAYGAIGTLVGYWLPSRTALALQ